LSGAGLNPHFYGVSFSGFFFRFRNPFPALGIQRGEFAFLSRYS
jgi:hypothetical protein